MEGDSTFYTASVAVDDNQNVENPATPPVSGQQSSLEEKKYADYEDDDDSLMPLTKAFLQGKKVDETSPEVLASTVVDLEEHRNQLIMDGRFRESMKAQKALDVAKATQLQAVKKQMQEEQLQTVEEKRDVLNKDFQLFNEQMDQKQAELEEQIKEQINVLSERHQDELDEHDEEWQSEVKARQFNRTSQKLRILRTQQQLLMNAKRFDDAEQVSSIADNLAAAETKESHFQMLNSFLKSRDLLEKKHADEMDTLMKACEVRRSEFRYQREMMTKPFLNRTKNLQYEEEVSKDPERVWNLKHRNEGDTIQLYCKTRTVRSPPTKPANVSTFNTLPLPPLPIKGSPRKNRTQQQPRQTETQQEPQQEAQEEQQEPQSA